MANKQASIKHERHQEGGNEIRRGEWCCAATAASSRVISKQTDWNRPTEASREGEWGMDRRKVESTRVGVKHAKNRPWKGSNYNDLWKQKRRNSVKASATSCSMNGLNGIGWAGLLCDFADKTKLKSILVYFLFPFTHPLLTLIPDILPPSLSGKTDRTRDACES